MKDTNSLCSRYGLAENPFRQNGTDSINLIRRVHMNLSIDDNLALLKEEVFFKKTNHNLFLIGDSGMGKTHRVLVAHTEALKNAVFSRFVSFSSEQQSGMKQFLDILLPKGSALLSNDKWQRDIAKLKKLVKKEAYNPQVAAQIVAHALNKQTPSFLLIDDLDAVQMISDNQLFLSFLFSLSTLLQPGVLLLATMTPYFASLLRDQYPKGTSSFKMQFIEPLTDEDAGKILSKWMESYRLVNGLYPLFPFNHNAIELLNSQSQGNTRCFLDLADMALTAASYQKSVIITELIVKDALLSVSEKKPSLLEEKIIPKPFSLDIRHALSEDVSQIKHIGALPDSVVSAEINTLSDHTCSISERSTDVVPNSDLTDLTNPIEGGREEQNADERIDQEIPVSFSASPNSGIKKIDSSSEYAPHHSLQQRDEHLLDDVIDSIEQGKALDCSLMKTDNGSFSSYDDNGSTKNPIDPASIMHQAKTQRMRDSKKNEPFEKEDSDAPDKINDCWENASPKGDTLDFTDKQDEESSNGNKSDQLLTNSVRTGKKSTKGNNENQKKSKKRQRIKKDENDTVDSPKQTKRRTNNDFDESLKNNDGFCSGHESIRDENKPSNSSKKQTKKRSNPLIQNEKENGLNSEMEKINGDNYQLKMNQPQSERVSSDQSRELNTSLKRILRVRCPDCSKEFSIEIDEDTSLLTCPFCDFQGEF